MGTKIFLIGGGLSNGAVVLQCGQNSHIHIFIESNLFFVVVPCVQFLFCCLGKRNRLHTQIFLSGGGLSNGAVVLQSGQNSHIHFFSESNLFFVVVPCVQF